MIGLRLAGARGWLIAMLGLAMLVDAIDTLSWWHWTRMIRLLQEAPKLAATTLAHDYIQELPPAAARAKWLSDQDLGMIEADALSGVLQRLGRLQGRWLVCDPTGSKNLARAAILEGSSAAAVRELSQALLRDPTSPYLHRLAARILQAVGRRDEMRDHLAEAAAIAPDYDQPPLTLTPADEQWIEFESLRRRLQLYRSQRIKTLVRLAQELRQRGLGDEAQELLDGYNQHPLIQLELASQALAEAQTVAQAEQAAALTHGLVDDYRLPAGLRARAWSLQARAESRAGNFDGAVQAAEMAAELSNGSPAPFIELARFAEQQADYQQALGCIRRAWGLAPSDISILLQLAHLAELAGEAEEACQALQRATDLAPEREDLAIRLVDCYRRNGQSIKASIYQSQLLDRFPDSQLQ